jgi:predicted transcriptional regulator
VGASEAAVVELTDPRAIRAIAHPARLIVLDALYDQGRSLTATQAAQLTGTTPSAMSYHLRALERFGMVKHAEPTDDGRERPWVRAARDLRIRPPTSAASKAVLAATGAVMSVAMDVTRERLLAALERGIVEEGALPLDAVTRYEQRTLVVTPEEAVDLLTKIEELTDPLRAEHRRTPPPGSGKLTLAIAVVPDLDAEETPRVAEVTAPSSTSPPGTERS